MEFGRFLIDLQFRIFGVNFVKILNFEVRYETCCCTTTHWMTSRRAWTVLSYPLGLSLGLSEIWIIEKLKSVEVWKSDLKIFDWIFFGILKSVWIFFGNLFFWAFYFCCIFLWQFFWFFFFVFFCLWDLTFLASFLLLLLIFFWNLKYLEFCNLIGCWRPFLIIKIFQLILVSIKF